MTTGPNPGNNVNFLPAFMQYCEGTEIPEIFAMWAGVGGISCAMGRNCWIDFGYFQIYPNMYIMLVAGSGVHRKSTSIKQINELIREMSPHPHLISEQLTPQALIDNLRNTELADGTKKLRECCVGFGIADEFQTFLSRDSYERGIGPLLIKFYDCDKEFEYRTKGKGGEVVRNACLGLLGASTAAWIREAIPESAIGGGLTSRVIFVYTAEPVEPVPIPVFPDWKRQLRGQLIDCLNRVQTLSGEFQISPMAVEYYKKEYTRFLKNNAFLGDKLLQGYVSRRHIHMLKLSMLLSAAESNAKSIEERHIAGATGMLVQIEKSLPIVMHSITTSGEGDLNELVLDIIKAYREVPRGEVMRRVSHKLTARQLAEIEETLVNSGYVKRETRLQNGVPVLWYIYLKREEDKK